MCCKTSIQVASIVTMMIVVRSLCSSIHSFTQNSSMNPFLSSRWTLGTWRASNTVSVWINVGVHPVSPPFQLKAVQVKAEAVLLHPGVQRRTHGTTRGQKASQRPKYKLRVGRVDLGQVEKLEMQAQHIPWPSRERQWDPEADERSEHRVLRSWIPQLLGSP